MPRRFVSREGRVPLANRRSAAADAFVESLGEPKKKRPRSSKKGLSLALADLPRVFVEGAARDGFFAKHLVALYARLHEQVYGAPPGELEDGKSFFAAASAAEKLVREEFAGSLPRAVEFLRWTWRRERAAEARRRAGGAETRRIGWKLQFAMRHLVTDYRVDRARSADERLRKKDA